MKNLTILFFLSVWLSLPASATNYYVNATGGADGNAGTSTALAWQTLNKINAATFANGDSILFKRGETFYGPLVIPHALIAVSYYGTGAQPIISGGITVSSWTSSGAGVYRATLPGAKNALNMVTINGLAQEVGRWPNADQPNGGYLLASGFFGNTTITATRLDTLNWTGAEIVRRVYGYLIERERITSQTSTTVTYSKTIQTVNPRNGVTGTSTAPIANGVGIFVQRDLRTLDKFGEWYFDSTTHILSVFFGGASPGSYLVQASGIDTLLNCTGKSNVTVDNIDFECGNVSGAYFDNSPNFTLTNCTINNTVKAVFGWFSPNILISGNSINWALCGAIDVRSNGSASNITFTNNKIRNTALYKGMSSFSDPADGVTIYAGTGTGALVQYNDIDSCSGNAIRFDGFGCNIYNNHINHYGLTRNDIGGIYAFRLWNANFNIANNIVENSMDASAGTNENNGSHLIYMDGGEGTGFIRNNTLINAPGTGYQATFAIFLNSPKNVVVTGNVSYNSNGWYNGRQHTDSSFGLTVKNNIFYMQAGQMASLYTHTGLDGTVRYTSTSIGNAMAQMGVVDSNTYNTPGSTIFSNYYKATAAGSFTTFSNLSLASWQSLSTLDLHSTVSNVTGNNIYTNPTNAAVPISFPTYRKTTPSGAIFDNSYTLTPYSSVVLIDAGLSPVTTRNYFLRRRRH